MTLTAAVVLAAVAVALAVPTPLLLARSRWPHRRPMLALVIWQLIAVVGGLATVSVPVLLGEAVSGGAGLTVGAPVAAAFALYLGVHLVRTIVRRETRRRRHLALLELLSSDAPAPLDARLIEQPEPLAYCVPRPRGAMIVISTGLLERLDERELQAVIAHERAHARQRHDVLLLAFEAWRAALPGFPAARIASEQVARLVEMAADDRARRRVGSPDLVRAIARTAPVHGDLERARIVRLLPA
jgi:Zn-dependent protease with chaperone function